MKYNLTLLPGLYRMNNSAAPGRILRVTIHLRDNSTKEISEDVCNCSGDNIDMKLLSQNLVSLQTKVNNFLTDLVEQERGTTQVTTESNNKQEQEDDDEDGDDDEEDGIEEPPAKQQKR